MKLIEFAQNELENAFYDPSKDEYTKRHLDDTRKPKLTLATLNRLKRMRALRKLEALKREDLMAVMYAQPDGDAGGGFGGGF